MYRFMGENPDIPEPPSKEGNCFPCHGTGRVLTRDECFAFEKEAYPLDILMPRWPERFSDDEIMAAINGPDAKAARVAKRIFDSRYGLPPLHPHGGLFH
jgi:hypothetical protein